MVNFIKMKDSSWVKNDPKHLDNISTKLNKEYNMGEVVVGQEEVLPIILYVQR